MPDSLGDRMKRYENSFRITLPRRMPVIIRVDGRAFHTFTRGFKRPFDEIMTQTMRRVAIDLSKEVAGCKMAYVQSDEISLLVTNDDTIDTEPWFGNGLQKLVSITSSIATRSFNHWYNVITGEEKLTADDRKKYEQRLDGATFDSRAFILPDTEVANYFLWRQQDATRNSIEACAQSMFSQKELHGKNCNTLQDMMMTQHGFNWNNLPTHQKRGACTRKYFDGEWYIDDDIPIFSKDRAYIEDLIPSIAERMKANG